MVVLVVVVVVCLAGLHCGHEQGCLCIKTEQDNWEQSPQSLWKVTWELASPLRLDEKDDDELDDETDGPDMQGVWDENDEGEVQASRNESRPGQRNLGNELDKDLEMDERRPRWQLQEADEQPVEVSRELQDEEEEDDDDADQDGQADEQLWLKGDLHDDEEDDDDDDNDKLDALFGVASVCLSICLLVDVIAGFIKSGFSSL